MDNPLFRGSLGDQSCAEALWKRGIQNLVPRLIKYAYRSMIYIMWLGYVNAMKHWQLWVVLSLMAVDRRDRAMIRCFGEGIE